MKALLRAGGRRTDGRVLKWLCAIGHAWGVVLEMGGMAGGRGRRRQSQREFYCECEFSIHCEMEWQSRFLASLDFDRLVSIHVL